MDRVLYQPHRLRRSTVALGRSFPRGGQLPEVRHVSPDCHVSRACFGTGTAVPMESTDLVAVAERREAMAVEAFATLQHGASVEELARVLRTVLDGSVVSGVGAEQVSAYADTWVQMHERAVPTFSEFIGLFNELIDWHVSNKSTSPFPTRSAAEADDASPPTFERSTSSRLKRASSRSKIIREEYAARAQTDEQAGPVWIDCNAGVPELDEDPAEASSFVRRGRKSTRAEAPRHSQAFDFIDEGAHSRARSFTDARASEPSPLMQRASVLAAVKAAEEAERSEGLGDRESAAEGADSVGLGDRESAAEGADSVGLGERESAAEGADSVGRRKRFRKRRLTKDLAEMAVEIEALDDSAQPPADVPAGSVAAEEVAAAPPSPARAASQRAVTGEASQKAVTFGSTSTVSFEAEGGESTDAESCRPELGKTRSLAKSTGAMSLRASVAQGQEFEADHQGDLNRSVVGIYSCHGIEPPPSGGVGEDKINQDCGCVACPFARQDSAALFCVFDGHGRHGHDVSQVATPVMCRL